MREALNLSGGKVSGLFNEPLALLVFISSSSLPLGRAPAHRPLQATGPVQHP